MKMTFVDCFITGPSNQIYAFWRARAPPGYATVGDYLTPTLVNLRRFVFSIAFVNLPVTLTVLVQQRQATHKRNHCCEYQLCQSKEARVFHAYLALILIQGW